MEKGRAHHTLSKKVETPTAMSFREMWRQYFKKKQKKHLNLVQVVWMLHFAIKFHSVTMHCFIAVKSQKADPIPDWPLDAKLHWVTHAYKKK